MTGDYRTEFYQDTRTGRMPVQEYLEALSEKENRKALSYINLLVQSDGYLDEPYARHIDGPIRELRVDFARNHHRIFYFAMIGRRIVLLHAFRKTTVKTPLNEIQRAKERYQAHMMKFL